MPRAALRAAAILALLVAAGCAGGPAPRLNVVDSRIDRDHRPTCMGLPLATGQVIVSEAAGAYSFFFSLVPDRFFYFTHAAIIVMEDGAPYVYDVAGRYKPGFDDRPTDAIVGGLGRTPFYEYCLTNLYAEIFDPPPEVDVRRVAAWIQERYRQGIEFDPYFRYDEHEKLFCTEFVALALEAGGARPVPLVPVRKNPSLAVALRYLAVPLDTALPAGLFADPARYRGAIGVFPTRTAAHCYFEAKHEIHRRFREDQKLGNIFIFEGGQLYLRPGVETFVTAAVHLFDGVRKAPTPTAIELAVRDLAADTFGPLPDPAPRAPPPVPAAHASPAPGLEGSANRRGNP